MHALPQDRAGTITQKNKLSIRLSKIKAVMVGIRDVEKLLIYHRILSSLNTTTEDKIDWTVSNKL